jgi:hypothetical protein
LIVAILPTCTLGNIAHFGACKIFTVACMQ